MPEAITVRVEGLADLVKAVRSIDPTTAKSMRAKLVAISGQVLTVIRPKMPVGTSGKFQSSAKVRATTKTAGISWTKSAVPYAGAVEFGGWPEGRTYVKSGRYIFPTVDGMRGEIEDQIEAAMDALIVEAGLA